MEQLTSVAAGKNCEVLFDDDLHDMSLQGPVSVDLLAKEIPAIRDLAYFGMMQTRLYGRDVMISRTGYTGERGYEIFCRAQGCDASVGQHSGRGQGHGRAPCAVLDARYVAD